MNPMTLDFASEIEKCANWLEERVATRRDVFSTNSGARHFLNFTRILASCHISEPLRSKVRKTLIENAPSPDDLYRAIFSKNNILTVLLCDSIVLIEKYLNIKIKNRKFAKQCESTKRILEKNYESEEISAQHKMFSELISQADFATLSLECDFWIDLFCFQLNLKLLKKSDIHEFLPTDNNIKFLERILFKYISMNDVDRLSSLLRFCLFFDIKVSDHIQKSAKLLTLHSFRLGGATSHGMAYHLSRAENNSFGDIEKDVTLSTTLSVLETLALLQLKTKTGLENVSTILSKKPAKNSRSPSILLTGNDQGCDRSSSIINSKYLYEYEIKALDWIVKNIDYFNPIGYSNRDKMEFATKMLAELTFCCSRYELNLISTSLKDRLNKINAFCNEVFFNNDILKSFMLQNASSLPLFSIYSSLKQCGFEDFELYEKLRHVATHKNIMFGEYAPALNMDIAYSVIKCGFDWNGQSLEDLFGRSLLSSLPELTYLKDSDYYTMTHAIFFISDFGKIPQKVPSRIAEFFVENSKYMLFLFSSRGNWDLLGEILLCLIYLKKYSCHEFYSYLKLFLSSQSEDGSFISLIGSSRESRDDIEWSEILDKYHTTLVFLLITNALRVNLSAEYVEGGLKSGV